MVERILFVVNHDEFFISHRLPIATELTKRGCEVHILCPNSGRFDELVKLGFHMHELDLSRRGLNPLRELKALFSIFYLVRKLRPNVVHAVTIKPVLYAGIVCRVLRTKKFVASISGLGYAFIDEGRKARFVRAVARRLYRFALGSHASNVIFQNLDDKQAIAQLVPLNEEQVFLIRGSGVDLQKYVCGQSSGSVPVVMLLARLLVDKGVNEFMQMAAELKSRNISARFVVVGTIDLGNPNSITQRQLDAWKGEGDVEFWGYSSEPELTIHNADVMVLPSYREGLPKSLIEAAACGKAVVTTDVPGCRDAIEPDVTGLLVPPKDPVRLAEAIKYLIDNPEVRERMCKEGRRLAEEAFDVRSVVKMHMEIYGLDK